jgi:hypothetical protein
VYKAFVFLNCDAGTQASNIRQMKEISGVADASGVSGIYDIVAEVNAESDTGVAGIVKKFRSIDSIRSCLTMIVAEKQTSRASRMMYK